MKIIKKLYRPLALSLLFSFFCIKGEAQEAFRYQAVVRDSTGATLPTKQISVRASIIQLDQDLPPVYQETHFVESNDYGVVQLDIGTGICHLGVFDTINWKVQSFLQIEIDVDGGNNYSVASTSEILSVPKAIYAERARKVDGGIFGLIVTHFGAKGDGITDDTEAFERALDSAKVTGAQILVPNGIYKITRSLIIEGGVSLVGEGAGSDPLETPYNGSLIWYYGDDYAVKMIGHNAKLRDLVIRDKSEETAKGGILVEANGRLVENVYLYEILISGFVNGTGVKLSAINNGGVYFNSFTNVRVRHGKIGVHIHEGNESFVNSNSWHYCQISGGGFDYGVLVEGGNNNNIHGLVLEPYSSTYGHFYVTKGQVYGKQIRIEAIQQPEDIPVIYFARQTKNSILSGVYAGGLTLDKGNNAIEMRSGKAIQYKNSDYNNFDNATLFSPDGVSILGWDLQGNYTSMSVQSPELTNTHNVLKIIIPVGGQVFLEADECCRPKVSDLSMYDQVNFGFHVKAAAPEMVHTFTNAINGWTRSTFHSGSGEWEFVGMNASINRDVQSRFQLVMTNNSGTEQTIYVSTPTLSFGNQLPTLEEKSLNGSGGKLYGHLAHSYAAANIPGNGYLDLPRIANYYDITGSQPIYRINHTAANRFQQGSVITLLFKEAGIGVTNSPYLELKEGFTSVANSSLTLISNGNGTWREVSRNN
jgi:hypothetical protein